MKKIMIPLAALALLLMVAQLSPMTGYPWRDHAPPFDFRFGNHFDMHQQSQRLDGGKIQGFQYIEFSGATTPDGYPIAMHGQATVGWSMNGIPGRATLVALGMHHPTWVVEPDEIPREPGYVYFHWVGGPLQAEDIGKSFQGFFLKHTALASFFFRHHDSLVSPGIDYNFAPNIVTSWP